MVDALSTAKLVIYIILSQPALYVAFEHGKPGFLGWFYVQLFCGLRLVTDILTIKPGLASAETTMILNSVGLAPLLFACAGILHEARRARDPTINNRKEWGFQIQYHLLVMCATILNVIGVVKYMTDGPSSLPNILTKVGATLAVLGWVVLVAFSLYSLKYNAVKSASTYRDGTLLLYGVIATLPFNGLRLAYSVTSLILRVEHPTSGFLSSVAVEVCIGVVPEILVVIILVLAGFKTRGVRQLFRERTQYAAPVPKPGV